MTPFTYTRATTVEEAIQAYTRAASSHESHAPSRDIRFLGGGTNLLDLMKMGVEQPAHLIDINRLPLTTIEEYQGDVRVGAMVTNTDAANHELIRTRYPVLSEAILAGASPQLRNKATMGGNLLQRTRCYYFYDPSYRECNKRNPGSGCAAKNGYNRIHAILGTSEECIAVHPSDMCVALIALDAVVRVRGPQGERLIPMTEFHRLPGSTPQFDTNLHPGELITAIDIPAMPYAKRSTYLKVRDRNSYAFALVSVAAAIDLDEHGTIRRAHIALGGVAHRPWRAFRAERALAGRKPQEKALRAAADAELAGARPYHDNGFKVELARRSMVRAVSSAVNLA